MHRVIPRIHYRLALVEVGYPLRYLRGTKELIHGTRTAYIGESGIRSMASSNVLPPAAWEAFKKCRRLHRDISVNNIILVKKDNEWRDGILIDWEISTKAGESCKADDHERNVSGIWPSF